MQTGYSTYTIDYTALLYVVLNITGYINPVTALAGFEGYFRIMKHQHFPAYDKDSVYNGVCWKDKREGVDRTVTSMHFVMKMRPRAATTIAHITDKLSSLNILTFINNSLTQMSIKRFTCILIML
jgi:hypothetical protein